VGEILTTFLIDLPVSTGYAFNFSTVLSGVLYKLSFKYNVRDEGWYFHIYDAGGVPLAMGQKACVNIPLLAQLTDSRMPEGYLLLLDTSGRNEEAGPLDIGGRVKLVYDDLITDAG
jgi:hypothetical protein